MTTRNELDLLQRLDHLAASPTIGEIGVVERRWESLRTSFDCLDEGVRRIAARDAANLWRSLLRDLKSTYVRLLCGTRRTELPSGRMEGNAMIPTMIPRRWKTLPSVFFCVLVSTIVFFTTPVFARSSPVSEADDPSLAGEGRPHDWDSPTSGATLTLRPVDHALRIAPDRSSQARSEVPRIVYRSDAIGWWATLPLSQWLRMIVSIPWRD